LRAAPSPAFDFRGYFVAFHCVCHHHAYVSFVLRLHRFTAFSFTFASRVARYRSHRTCRVCGVLHLLRVGCVSFRWFVAFSFCPRLLRSFYLTFAAAVALRLPLRLLWTLHYGCRISVLRCVAPLFALRCAAALRALLALRSTFAVPAARSRLRVVTLLLLLSSFLRHYHHALRSSSQIFMLCVSLLPFILVLSCALLHFFLFGYRFSQFTCAVVRLG